MTDVFFLNENEGWIVGNGGLIMHTSNGGENWIIVAAGLTNSLLRGVHFTSPTNGYVVGNGKTLLKYGELSGTGSSIAETLQFELFPNPAGNEFRVSSLEFRVGGATLEIYGLNGRKLLEKQISRGTEEIIIDVSRLNSGVYMCRVSTEDYSATKKVIIQK